MPFHLTEGKSVCMTPEYFSISTCSGLNSKITSFSPILIDFKNNLCFIDHLTLSLLLQ